MHPSLGACIFVSFFAVGCGVGDDGVEPDDPNPEKIVCADAFKVTGTFTPGTPARPATDANGDPFTGCWPVGTWNFTASLDPSDENVIDITGDQVGDRCGAVTGTQVATLDASYSFAVNRTDDGDGWVDSYVLNGAAPEGDRVRWNDKYLFRIKVTEGCFLKFSRTVTHRCQVSGPCLGLRASPHSSDSVLSG